MANRIFTPVGDFTRTYFKLKLTFMLTILLFLIMAPNISEPTEEITVQAISNNVKNKNKKYKWELVWRNIILVVYFHLAGIYGFYLMFTSAKILTSLWGVTADAHRLWLHRSYKAKWPLRLFLALCHSLAFQSTIFGWARDHRVHQKYSETDADPHNATRGIFFSHFGWVLCRKHPEVKAKGKGLNLSDLYEDPIVKYQKKYYLRLMLIICFIVPTVVPMYFWKESFVNASCLNILRYTFTLNAIFFINSAAHLIGHRPYHRFINPSENIGVAVVALGEGWHNYHHTIPWDYKASELGKYNTNFTTAFTDFMAKIGLAYELKTVPVDMIKKRVKKTEDGTHKLWGRGDKDQPKEETQEALITYKKDL